MHIFGLMRYIAKEQLCSIVHLLQSGELSNLPFEWFARVDLVEATERHVINQDMAEMANTGQRDERKAGALFRVSEMHNSEGQRVSLAFVDRDGPCKTKWDHLSRNPLVFLGLPSDSSQRNRGRPSQARHKFDSIRDRIELHDHSLGKLVVLRITIVSIFKIDDITEGSVV